MSDLGNDRLLDARLCDVPLPDALTARLRGIAELSDGELDRQVSAVTLPKGLCFRLRQVADDEQVDEQLRDVPLRSLALARARIIPLHRPRSRVGRWAVAASLMIALSLGFWSGLGGLLVTVQNVSQPAVTMFVLDEHPLELAGSQLLAELSIEPGPTLSGPADPVAFGGGKPDEFALLVSTSEISPGPAGELFAQMGHSWDPRANWMRLRWPQLGYPQPEVQTLPDLEFVRSPVGRGFPVPLTRAYDREFLYSRGSQPPVMIRADETSRTMPVPLSTSTDSYARFRRGAAEGRLPPPNEIQPEEFLAAVDYSVPPAPAGRVALRTAAGPSVFNPGSAGLLQIVAKAGMPQQPNLPATHLTVALDLSASMAWGQRLDAARQGLLRALAQLRPGDRFSLVAFREEPCLLVSEASRSELPKLYNSLAELQPGGGCNLHAALEQAVVAALDSDGGAPPARRLVLITDSGAAFSPAAVDSLSSMLQAAAQGPFRFDVLDLGDPQEQADRPLETLAAAGGGSVHRVQTASEIRWQLVEALLGTPVLVASEVKLQLQFNPKAVAAYRLIGHQAASSGGLLSGEGSVELHAGQEAVALLEVWLYPNDEDDVAQARLEWTDPLSGRTQRAEPQRISRLQFATSFAGAAVNLQQAAIVAEAAEVLAQGFNFSLPEAVSYRYEPKPRGLEHVLQAARRASPQLLQRPDYRQLIQSLQAAQRLTPERPRGLARSGARGINAGRWLESRE